MLGLFRNWTRPNYTPVVGGLPDDVARFVLKRGRSPCHGTKMVVGLIRDMNQNMWCPDCHTRYNIVTTVCYGNDVLGECVTINDDAGFKACLGDYDLR